MGQHEKYLYLDLKVLRIWGMLKSIRWLILISQISIGRLILEIFWVEQLHRNLSPSLADIPGPATESKTTLICSISTEIPDSISFTST